MQMSECGNATWGNKLPPALYNFITLGNLRLDLTTQGCYLKNATQIQMIYDLLKTRVLFHVDFIISIFCYTKSKRGFALIA